MKKFLIFCLTIISATFLSVAFSLSDNFSRVKAENSTLCEVETFLPSSALQLYDLKSPVSISYSESGYAVISEHIGNLDGTSLFDRISVYNPVTKRYFAIPDHPTIYNVTHATEWNGYVFYLSSSKLYSVPTDNLTETPTFTGVTSSNFFMIKGNFIVTNTNNTIVIHRISLENGEPVFEETSTHRFSTKNAFISSENNIYYLNGGQLYCFDTASTTSYVVADVTVEVNYMAELNDYVYLTSSSGIYKVKKGKGEVLEKITEVTQNANQLGYILNPQGITVMNGQLLVADSTVKCVQALTPDGEFTEFAITTESTADYRLTNNASKISLSENYVYALDDGSQNENGISYKRIVRTSLDKSLMKRHLSISLEPIYKENEGLDVKFFACSDTHLAIYHGKFLSLYNIENGTPELVFETESESVTSLFYLDGEFYYTDYALLQFGYNAVNVKKIVLPSENNGLTKITVQKINEETEIKGVAINACVDVFGNFYLNLAETPNSENSKLIRYSNGSTLELCGVDKQFISFKSDFAGNVFGLDENGTITKFSYNLGSNLVETFKLNTEMPIKDFDLSYQTDVCYLLSNACILSTSDNTLGIANLSDVGKATDLDEIITNLDGKFITVDKNAKLFKVTLGDYNDNGTFKTITPVTNPRSDKVYLIVDEIDNYYLVSYSEKFVALVRKTDTEYSPNLKFTSAIIGNEYYDDFNISVTNKNETKIITNETTVFAKPIFDSSYKISTLDKGETVTVLNQVDFNGTTTSLISIDGGETAYGYIVSGYLNGEIITPAISNTKQLTLVGGDGNRHFNNVLMVLIIAFTITFIALFIEKKLLFDKEDANKNV